MKAIGYMRVSTEEQAKEGISLEAQNRAIETYAKLKGLELEFVFEDAGVSTKIPLERRPGGLGFLNALDRESVTAVIAFKLDRMFRNTVECLTQLEQWDRRGIAVHFIDLGGQAIDSRSAMGRFFLTIMAACAELERNQTSERVVAIREYQKTNGKFGGGFVPWGYLLQEDGTLVTNDDEQNAILAARRLRKKGWSLRKIGAELLERDFRPRKKGEWSSQQVKTLLAAGEV